MAIVPVVPGPWFRRFGWPIIAVGLLLVALMLFADETPREPAGQLAAFEQIPYFGARFERIAPPLYDWQSMDIDSSQSLPTYPYQTADSSAEIKLYITVQYIDPSGSPGRLRDRQESLFTAEGLQVIPQFVKGDPIYLVKRPPGYALMITLYSAKRRVDQNRLKEIVSAAISDCVPIVYDPNLYLKTGVSPRRLVPPENRTNYQELAAR